MGPHGPTKLGPWTWHPGELMGAHDSDNKRGTAKHWEDKGHDPAHVNANQQDHHSDEDHKGGNLDDPMVGVKLHNGK